MKFAAKIVVFALALTLVAGCGDGEEAEEEMEQRTEQCMAADTYGNACNDIFDCPPVVCVCGDEDIAVSTRACDSINGECAVSAAKECGGEGVDGDGLCEGSWEGDCFAAED